MTPAHIVFLALVILVLILTTIIWFAFVRWSLLKARDTNNISVKIAAYVVIAVTTLVSVVPFISVVSNVLKMIG